MFLLLYNGSLLRGFSAWSKLEILEEVVGLPLEIVKESWTYIYRIHKQFYLFQLRIDLILHWTLEIFRVFYNRHKLVESHVPQLFLFFSFLLFLWAEIVHILGLVNWEVLFAIVRFGIVLVIDVSLVLADLLFGSV